tara:strand:- start:3763 stop:4071 length:309 start_codon:yes stop_codon:yes gene_type:complete
MNYKDFKQNAYKDILPKIRQVIEFDNLKEKSRKRHISHKRFYLMWFMRNELRMNLGDIAHEFNMHHSSIIHAIKYHNNSIEIKDVDYKNNIQIITEFLGTKI